TIPSGLTTAYITGNVLNDGSVSVENSATLSLSGNFDQVAGTLDVAGTFALNGSTLTYHGGTISAPLMLTNATLDLAAPGDPPATFIFVGGSNYLAGDIPAGHTVIVRDSSFYGSGLLASNGG